MSLIRIDDIQMAYTDTGVGRPIVLIHGYPFNRSLWNEQVAALSTSYRIIVPDLRGFGESDSSPGPATMNRMAQDVAQLIGPSRNLARSRRRIVDGRLRGTRVLQTVSVACSCARPGRHARASRHRRRQNKPALNRQRKHFPKAWPASPTRCCQSCSRLRR